MKKLSKLLLVLSFALSITSSAFAVVVASWGGAYTESQKLGYGDPTAKADEVIERTKVTASNNLLNFFIYPPFKRFYKKRITTIIKNGVNSSFLEPFLLRIP